MAISGDKKIINFFVSYVHEDDPQAAGLLDLLRRQLAPAKRYDYRLWQDRALLVGQAWRAEIDQALAACDIGLLLVSPSFLASPFIREVELPQLLKNNPVVPVMLQAVDFHHHDLQGLDAYQIYRLDRQRPFGKCRDRITKNRFVEELYLQIEQRLSAVAHPTMFGGR